jgi:undecaprenyl-diphosphatase
LAFFGSQKIIFTRMIEQLKHWDEELLLFLNRFHTDALDPVMYLVTRTDFWIPLYVVLVFLIFKNYKKEGWMVMAGVALAILLSDQITSGLMKPFFQRLRPSNEPALDGIIHIVNGYHGGQYGFASSHAANTTGVAFIVFLVLKKIYRWMWLIFFWAFIMSYTRIYLGVHYPGDIIAGALVGIASGYAGYGLYLILKRKFERPPEGNHQRLPEKEDQHSKGGPLL